MRKIQNKARKYFLLAAVVSVLCAAPVLVLSANPARVATYAVRSVSMTSANLQGFVSDDGGCASMSAWFEYGKTTAYGKGTSGISRSGVGYFSEDIFDLSPCTTYHFRAVARNNTGTTAYGSDMIFKTQCASFDVKADVKNIIRGDEVWYKSLNAEPGDELLYRIYVASTGDVLIQNLMLASDLPDNVSYEGDFRIDEQRSQYNIVAGSINLGNLFPQQTKILTFKAKVGQDSRLSFGRNDLVHSVVAYTTDYSDTDVCTVMVTRKGVAGASIVAPPVTPPPTQVVTGITNGLSGSVLLPLGVALFCIWIFRSKLICFDGWVQKRKIRAEQYRAKRKLASRVSKLRGTISGSDPDFGS